MTARKERVGGGRTNMVSSITATGESSRPPSGAGVRPSTAACSRHPRDVGSMDSPATRSQDSEPHSRPSTAPTSRPATSGSARPPPGPSWQKSWQQDGEKETHGDRGSGFFENAPMREADRVKRDELFTSTRGGSGHVSDNGGSRAGSRPGTAESKASRSSRDGRTGTKQRPPTASSMSSETSEQCEERLLQFQKYFQDKNFAKFSLLKDAFRHADKDKNGVLGPQEIEMAMAALDIPVDRRLVDRLMLRCENPENMSMQEFKTLLWADDSMTTYIDDRKNRRAGTMPQSTYKHLWTRIKPVVTSKFIGTLNDTAEADRRDAGDEQPRLDYNFSSVSYDILSFAERTYNPPGECVKVPVKKRPYFFDPPPSAGRRVAYDRGDSPYNIVSLESPRAGHNDATPPMSYVAPVRISTFARVHSGAQPTQLGHMLAKTTV